MKKFAANIFSVVEFVVHEVQQGDHVSSHCQDNEQAIMHGNKYNGTKENFHAAHFLCDICHEYVFLCSLWVSAV